MESKINLKFILPILLSALILSCNSNILKETPIKNFYGTWELKGRKMFNGIIIKIEKDKNGKVKGKVVKLNNNKYVKMFLNVNDTWVSDIKRKSNYEFKLTEKKIASDLFGVYGLKTSNKFFVQFLSPIEISLRNNKSDPIESKIRYKKITINKN